MLEQNSAPPRWGLRVKAYLMAAGLTALLTAALAPGDDHGVGGRMHRLAAPTWSDG